MGGLIEGRARNEPRIVTRSHGFRWARRAVPAMVACALAGCHDEHPTRPELDLTTAEARLDTAITLFECSYSTFGMMALGEEDVVQSVAGVFHYGHVYDPVPRPGRCGAELVSVEWLEDMRRSRRLLSDDPGRLVPTATGEGVGVYDRLQEFAFVSEERERLSAISAIYVAAALGHLGEFLCEISVDGSDLLDPIGVLDLAEEWITGSPRIAGALGHIDAYGDFALPKGIAPSARRMALALRSRIRWAKGDLQGATEDATNVLSTDPGFTAWITRDDGSLSRRNHTYEAVTANGLSFLLGVNDWWDSGIRRANPVTGDPWPDPVPFTGYRFLAIQSDGRTLDEAGIPIRWAEDERDVNWDPIPLENGAVPDTRIPHHAKGLSGPELPEVPARYSSATDDIPFLTWEELRLIQADYAFQEGDAPGVIERVNLLREAHGLPTISGDWEALLLADRDAVRSMLLEERRRELFSEGGRYWSTKIQNTDALWFPRGEGKTPHHGYLLQGAVRQTFLESEYTENPHFVARGGLEARGTGCATLPGSQTPYLE